MSLTSPIPKLAMPVVRILRRDVPRPGLPPVLYRETHGINPQGEKIKSPILKLRWLMEKGPTCPMGLHPKTHGCAPWVLWLRGQIKCSINVEVFATWWDNQDDPEAAVDAVWGKA